LRGILFREHGKKKHDFDGSSQASPARLLLGLMWVMKLELLEVAALVKGPGNFDIQN
jgi:hypothetical protein